MKFDLAEKDKIWAAGTVDKIRRKMNFVSERSQNKIPYAAIAGMHDDRSDETKKWNIGDGISWWCNGFWGGMMWQMYSLTKEEKYLTIARRVEEKLDRSFKEFDGLHHDVGFMWLPTAVADYRITGNSASRRRALHAAHILAGRFNPRGQFIRAWNDMEDVNTTGWAIIDCMLNIPLLYWASEETGDPRFRQIAVLHANKTLEHFIRPDGSVNHIVEFDPHTGAFVKSYGGQGYGEGSAWTRGQAWAIYGFTISYLHTDDRRYLDAAKRAACYFMAHIPEDGLIPVDFRQPKVPAYEDASAAAIAACGLLEMAGQTEGQEQSLYVDTALQMLKTLEEKRCDWSLDSDGILDKCTAAYHDKAHEFNTIYGDYYFIEAMMKVNGTEMFIW